MCVRVLHKNFLLNWFCLWLERSCNTDSALCLGDPISSIRRTVWKNYRNSSLWSRNKYYMIRIFIKYYIVFLLLCSPQTFLKPFLLDQEMVRYIGWGRSLIQLLLVAFTQNSWIHLQSLVLRGGVKPLSDSPKGLDRKLAMSFRSLLAALCQAVFHSEAGLSQEAEWNT